MTTELSGQNQRIRSVCGVVITLRYRCVNTDVLLTPRKKVFYKMRRRESEEEQYTMAVVTDSVRTDF